MAFLSDVNNEIIVGATLTEYGRKKLAQGKPLSISKFSIGDDGVDYNQLWNASHPNGEAYDGVAIERMAVQEAVPSSVTSYRYNLFTSDKKLDFIYTLNHGIDNVLLTGVSRTGTYYIRPQIVPMSVSEQSYAPWYKITWSSGIGAAPGQYMKINGIFTSLKSPKQYSTGWDGTHSGYFAGETFVVEVITMPSIPLTFQINIAAVLEGVSIRSTTSTINLYAAEQPPTEYFWENDVQS